MFFFSSVENNLCLNDVFCLSFFWVFWISLFFGILSILSICSKSFFISIFFVLLLVSLFLTIFMLLSYSLFIIFSFLCDSIFSSPNLFLLSFSYFCFELIFIAFFSSIWLSFLLSSFTVNFFSIFLFSLLEICLLSCSYLFLTLNPHCFIGSFLTSNWFILFLVISFLLIWCSVILSLLRLSFSFSTLIDLSWV